jgi:Domain of unknown function (DUF4190)
VSDVSQGPGWWLASDGKWYSPEQSPGYRAEPWSADASGPGQGVETAPTVADPGVPVSPYGYGQSSGSPPGDSPPLSSAYGPPTGPPPGYGSPMGPGYGQPPGPPPGYASPMGAGYGYPPGGPQYAYVPVRRTNGLAIASLVCSIVWLGGVGSLLAVIFGFIARSQIKRAEDHQQGNGLALAGIILGFLGLVIAGLVIVAAALVVHHCDQTGNCTTTTYNFGS